MTEGGSDLVITVKIFVRLDEFTFRKILDAVVHGIYGTGKLVCGADRSNVRNDQQDHTDHNHNDDRMPDRSIYGGS